MLSNVISSEPTRRYFKVSPISNITLDKGSSNTILYLVLTGLQLTEDKMNKVLVAF